MNDLWTPYPRDPAWETARPRIDWAFYVGRVVVIEVDLAAYSEWYGHKIEMNDVVVLTSDAAPLHVGPCWTSAQPIVSQLRPVVGQVISGRIERDDDPGSKTLRYMLDMLYTDEEQMVTNYLKEQAS